MSDNNASAGKRIIKRTSLVNVQPMHSASRLSELGMDPLRATVDKIREMELMLYTMRQMGKRSLIAETTLYANITKSIQSLIPYGYMTVNEVERHLASLKDKDGFGDADGVNNGIQIFLTGGDNDSPLEIESLVPAPSSVQTEPGIQNSTDNVSQGKSEDRGKAEFVPDETIHEAVRGLPYQDRVDAEAGLVEIMTEDGEVLNINTNGNDNMLQSIMSAKRAASGPGQHTPFAELEE